MVDRYTDRLFRDILVPLSGEPESWHALEQALLIAKTESAVLHGIHIVSSKSNSDSNEALAIQADFSHRCEAAGVTGSLVIEKGNVPEAVCHRALLADLVVLNVAHPPSAGLTSLGSGLRSIIWRSARPILTVPGKFSPMTKTLIAFDNSTKSKEAVFVATYLAERFKTSITVLTISDDAATNVQDYARDYLAIHEIQADFVVVPGSREAFLDVIKEQGINLVVMGGYSGSAWQEIIIGSAVNFLLRQADCPLLICR
jgi:nucleotide-binding universal stress UspA family protein